MHVGAVLSYGTQNQNQSLQGELWHTRHGIEPQVLGPHFVLIALWPLRRICATNIFERQGGKWKLVLHQGGPAPPQIRSPRRRPS